MGFFDRLRQVFKGKAENSMARMESRNPAAVYEAAILEREKQYHQLKGAASELAVLRKKTEDELESKNRELSNIEAQIPIAVQEGEDEAALLLLEQKENLAARIAILEPELETLRSQVEETTAGLRRFQAEIQKLKREKSEMVSRKSNAEAQLQIQDTLSGLSTDADVKGLANVREHIDRLAVDADLDVAAAQRVTTRKLNQSRAASQLAALKREMQAKQSGTAPAADNAAPAAPAADGGAADEGAAQEDLPKRTL
ncbi:MAG: PspA/IM30 family protein [Myxococcota bacterium]